MKRRSFVCMTVILFAAFTCVPYGYTSLPYESIGSFSKGGPYSGPILENIQNLEQLNAFCVETQFDTSRLSKMPDFNSATMISLQTKWGGGNLIFSRTIQRIIDDIDTVFVEIHRDTQFLDSHISVEAGCEFTLVTIPKTIKPIILRASSITAVRSLPNSIPDRWIARVKSQRIFNAQGRLLIGRKGTAHGLIISVSSHPNGEMMFLGRPSR
jgi:hypothetical protein